MKVIIATWSATPEQKELALNIINKGLAHLDISEVQFEQGESIMHLKPDSDSIVVTFGPRAASILQTKTKNLIPLHSLSYLNQDKPTNEQFRIEAWNILTNYKIVKETPPELELTPKEIIALYELATGSLQNYYMKFDSVVWKLTTESGLSIAIVKDPKTITTDLKVNFILTFEEIMAASAAMDVLAINKLIIVKGKKEND